jgi:DNA polymerase I
MSKVYIDIEANGFLREATKAWIIGGKNLETGEIKYWLDGDLGWQEWLNSATVLIGHNIEGYDLPLLERLFDWKLPKTCKVNDTLILSQVLNYKRFGDNGHSLEAWGNAEGLPKLPSPDFSQYSEQMQTYWERDIELGVRVYMKLMAELLRLIEKEPKIKHYLRAEQFVSRWCARAEVHGWPFNLDKAMELFDRLDTELENTNRILSTKLGRKAKAIDLKKGEVDIKHPRWTKAGFYDTHTANWFGIDPCSGFEGEDRLIEGPYCRVEFPELDLNSVADVKIFLFRNGWKPTQWNIKTDPETGKKVKTSPKITEDSLEFLGGDGKLYLDFLTAKSRHSILKTWIEHVDDNGMLHGNCIPIGTPSMRARHTIIVNVPSVDSPWGAEMRALFGCIPGWKLVGCDSAGNQARGLAHYLGDETFINTLLHGDIHQYNADALTSVLQDMDELEMLSTLKDGKVQRSQAKRILYAFLFGASGGKLWSYIFGTLDDDRGKKLKNGFLKAVPGFKALLEKLENIFGKTKQYGEGYIPGIAGNRIYVDSFHKLLVYLLQACEKATCASALMLTMEQLEEEEIPYIPCIFYHDEIDFMVPEKYAERAAEIGRNAFRDGPKLFGIEIMDGGARIGDSWYEVH